ncbi:MAG: ATP-dependent DNA helicase RecG [Prevotellaceae bacterium]|jgi:ATP-dependent DNA helicase RecG|nr:ATP-dependent DNA helicase RecG [Prevotellaceae bacterium]
MSELSTKDIKFLSGVGPKKAELLKKELEISSFEDMLYYFPYRYIDRSKYYQIREITSASSYIQIKGKIIRMEQQGEMRKQRLSALFSDGVGTIELVWFKGVKFALEKYKVGEEYVVFGKPGVFNGKLNMVHPEMETVNEALSKQSLGGLQGLYNTTERMKSGFLNSKAIRKIVMSVIKSIGSYKMPETLPAYLLQKYNLLNLHESLMNIHFPQNPEMLRRAEYRLKLEELFYIQLNILRTVKIRSQRFKGFGFENIGHYFNTFYREFLPFDLTEAQKRVIREIRADVGSGKQMNRLLQGDVGSGKTLVALMVMLIALDNGFQACLMAPTEILATQHADSITTMLNGLGVNVSLLTGSTKKTERAGLFERLATGEIQILIGTHALLEDNVKFANLGMVVIDEQHRFGVAQRARLWSKNTQPPHVLVMTATPIPRTLAMTLYGDLDVSVIDRLPPGRKPVQTYHQFDNKRVGLYDFIKKQIAQGRQVYVVYPLIQESEKMDYHNLEEGYNHLQEIFPPAEYSISMVHGKMKPSEKEEQMQRFVSGQTQILIATTVIEVGVNVPNASVMVIESAERFGLSQLHQLRGRVGRGADQSYCVLITSPKLSNESRQRMEIMVRTNDGFEISEADLRMRGPGDLEGTQQSGIPFNLKIANLATDGQVLQLARQIAMEVLDEDPGLTVEKNFVLNKQLNCLARNPVNWGVIS